MDPQRVIVRSVIGYRCCVPLPPSPSCAGVQRTPHPLAHLLTQPEADSGHSQLQFNDYMCLEQVLGGGYNGVFSIQVELKVAQSPPSTNSHRYRSVLAISELAVQW